MHLVEIDPTIAKRFWSRPKQWADIAVPRAIPLAWLKITYAYISPMVNIHFALHTLLITNLGFYFLS